MGAYESGQSLLAGVLAKLPESARAQAKAIFEAAEAKDAVTLIGDSGLARSDYSKNMDDLKLKEDATAARLAELESWYGVNKNALDEYVQIKPKYDTLAAGSGTPNPNPPTPKPPLAYDPEDARRIAAEVVDGAGRDYINISAWMAAKSVDHLHKFGEPPDVMALVQNPKLGKPVAGQPGRVFSLEDAYNEKYHEQVAAKTKEVHDKQIETEVQKRLAEERSKHPGHPFPLRSEASVLDVLKDTNNNPSSYTVDSAVAEYDRLQSQRQG